MSSSNPSTSRCSHQNDVFVEDDMKNCPYHKCRYQILAEVVDTVDPILDVIAIVLYVIGVMVSIFFCSLRLSMIEGETEINPNTLNFSAAATLVALSTLARRSV